jgi:ribosomal protein L16 Arg81 hydroxylase
MHYDDHDVIIMQLDGCKAWTFVKHGESGKATAADLAKPDESRPGDSIVVSAGDVLYIPRGTWHNVTSLNERSLHLTVSVVYPTIGEFLAWCVDQHKVGIPSTDIKSDHQCIDRAIESCRTFLSTLACKENFGSFLSAFYSGKRCSRTRANFPSLNTANQVDSFRRVPFEIITLQPSQPDRCEVFALGRVHSLTLTEYAVLCGLPRTGAMSSAEIAKLGGGWASTAPVLESLLDRDLVTIVANEA